jgi:hypothetical protein
VSRDTRDNSLLHRQLPPGVYKTVRGGKRGGKRGGQRGGSEVAPGGRGRRALSEAVNAVCCLL